MSWTAFCRLLLWLGQTGDVLATWGRPGDGPGEFRRVERIGLMAGRVRVFDTALRRVTWFTTDGSVVGTKAFEEGPIGWTPCRIAGGLPFARGRYLGVPRASSGEISHPLDTWPLTILVDSGPMIERELALGAPVTAAIERSDGSPWPVLSPQLLPVTPLAEVVPSDQTREVVFVEPRPYPRGRQSSESTGLTRQGRPSLRLQSPSRRSLLTWCSTRFEGPTANGRRPRMVFRSSPRMRTSKLSGSRPPSHR